MEQSQKLLQSRNYMIAGIVVVLAIGYFVIQRQEAKAPQTSEEQVSGENTNNAQVGGETSQNTNDSTNQDQTTADSDIPTENAGNIEAFGTLQVSDIPSRGNLMLDSNRGKIYVKTSRDYTDLVGKQANLAAEGNINSFAFLGFSPGGSVPGNVAGTSTTDTSAVGGGDEIPTGTIHLSGTLGTSDNQSKGNYIINSAAGKIYFKSQHDYSAMQGSAVELTATGTINSFTGASLSKK